MPEPMTSERLAEIRRNEAEVADYITEGLMRRTSAYRDRTDLLAEVDRLKAEVADLRSRYDAQKDRADKTSARTRGLMRAALRRIAELQTVRDALNGQSARAERLDFAVKEIRDLFHPASEGGE
ncbi:hypothetical protein ACIBK9_47400 [Nonomuraea sp. NPDC050227]|uniref:hypothetical protein n=1 Tax=Nonomuraea sp. NPDC050227 TaxID=3364360 RepID=UPI003788CCF5